jgi:mannose-6-phosphate isomerase-like protein (cupin superfamily)
MMPERSLPFLTVNVVDLSRHDLGGPGDDFVIVRWTAEVGDHWIAPFHVHDDDDEAWYVLSGRLGFRLGDDEIVAEAGIGVLARRGVAHTYWNAGTTDAEYLLVMTPRIAELIDAIHQPGADVSALFRAHKSEILPSA